MGGGENYTWTKICVLKTLASFKELQILFKYTAHYRSRTDFVHFFNGNVLAVLDAMAIAQHNLGLCLNLIITNITPGAYFLGGLYVEGVFCFKSLFLNALRLIFGGMGEAYLWNAMVFVNRACTKGYFWHRSVAVA